MRIAVTASTGLFGSALVPRLRAAEHDVVPVVRGDQADPAAMWDPEAGWIRPGTFEDVDAVVHLSGASIGDGVGSTLNGVRIGIVLGAVIGFAIVHLKKR